MTRQESAYALGQFVRRLGEQITPVALGNVSRLPGLAPVLLRHVWPKDGTAPDVSALGRGPAAAEEQCGFWLGYYHAAR